MMFAALVGAALLAMGCAQEERWTQVGGCQSNVDTSPGAALWTIGGGAQNIRLLAQRATKLRICNENNECVTSTANSFPILNLRQGLLIVSHIDGEVDAPCDRNCVDRFWTGPEDLLAHLPVVGGYYAGRGTFYHASGNRFGMHVMDNSCVWSYGRRAGTVSVWLNIGQITLAPTTSPTTTPTEWFQHAGHRENVTELQATVVALAATVQTLTRTVTELARRSDLDAHIADTADRLELVNERVSVQRGLLLDNITALRSEVVEVATSVNTLKASLREAVASAASAAGSGPPDRSGGPVVSAVGDSLVVSAAGPVRVESGRCAVDDLCGATAFASSLQDALNDI